MGHRGDARLARVPHQTLGFPRAQGGSDQVGASVAAFEMLAHGDLSLTVKAGVQWGLFGGAVQALGTQVHHDRYLPSIIDFSLPGCFAMTETGHGSDVQGLRTTATYDPAAAGVRRPHPGRGRPQGLHRQRRARRPAGRGVRAARHGGRAARRARPAGPAARRRRPAAARRHDRGLRRRRRVSAGSTTGGSPSTTSGCRARPCSTATPRSPRTAPTPARSPRPAGGSSPCSAPWSAAG